MERGVLVILMAQGKPVTQTEFKKAHGLTAEKRHRDKLHSLGLIEVDWNPITYSLTSAGWEWLGEYTAGAKPRGAADAPLYAALGAIGRLAKRLGLPLEEALTGDGHPPIGPRPTDWLEADEYIARSLQDMPVFDRSLSRLRTAANGSLGDEVENAELSAELIFQAIRLAGRKRALVLEGEVGALTAFDPVFHLTDDDLSPGDPVRVRKSIVIRRQGQENIVVQPGFVEQIY
ncbi:hypothetical protein KKP04_14215 [Rhodomicrobium sp. Az07]|uniref:hypothetical protein n=1 Tax=Rhodomicrobium sp. Az07 TaxID=2839034 RepID=UPI001BE84D27|nr:hypothetical protein [Rhodomicrobium sp. Az07]MBT3072013.1 hypothetical protein [Rhodomicrobium sp. Az07]